VLSTSTDDRRLLITLGVKLSVHSAIVDRAMLVHRGQLILGCRWFSGDYYLNTAYVCTKFEEFCFSRSRHILGGLKFKIDHMT